jgi:chemotaxis protein methyltransferase CheR
MPTESLFTQQLSTADFEMICSQVYDYCGIKISAAKRQMVEGRLRKRVRALGCRSFAEYCRAVFGDGAFQDEFVHLVDAITTNKTEFFREPAHFSYLTKQLLPALHLGKYRLRRPLRVWSSACSTGQEPYSLAMELSEFKRLHDDFDFRVHATDICTQVLEIAVRAIYSDELANDIPVDYRKRYLLKSKDATNKTLRIGPEIRRYVQFDRLNLNESDYGMKGEMDIIFCRNVIIYFDAKTQEAILNRLALCLRKGGHLFLGHSETVHGMDLPVRAIAPTIYERI